MHAQARNAERPWRAIAGIAGAKQCVAAINEAHVQARQFAGLTRRQHAGLAQRRPQCVSETPRKPSQWFARVGIGMFDPYVAEGRMALQRVQHRCDAITRVQFAQFGQQHQLLPGEDQLPPRQRLRESGTVHATEHHEATPAFGARVATETRMRRALAELGREFGFEARTAVAEQSSVRPWGDEGSFARCVRASHIAAHHGCYKTVVVAPRIACASGTRDHVSRSVTLRLNTGASGRWS
jgi:hypothetical protein